MPRINRKRKAYIRSIMSAHYVKYDEALRIADDPDPAWVRELMDANDWSYDEVVAWREDPRNKSMCDRCDWTFGMICPECPGCGCYNGQCSGWRHQEYAHDDDDHYEDYGCCECGAGSGGDPYGECTCYDEDDADQDYAASAA